MQTLHWLTREEDIRAASTVPYRLLEEISELGYGNVDAGNMLIQGDNLDAPKALTGDGLSGHVNEKLFPCRTPVLVHLSGPRPFVHPPFERLRL
jgi:hypothetical protein